MRRLPHSSTMSDNLHLSQFGLQLFEANRVVRQGKVFAEGQHGIVTRQLEKYISCAAELETSD